MTTTTTGVLGANAAALRAYLDDHDPDALAPDATFIDTTTGMTWTGPEAIGGMLAWFYHGVFEARLEGSRVIVDADGTAAALEATFVGIHKGEFAGVPATGREVRVPLVVVYDLADERVVGGRIHFDAAAFVAQATR
ncbi:MAG: ester cyclase [Chloroflexi bacterium]|nr:ester cyclase [Chloroflexota bacterium]